MTKTAQPYGADYYGGEQQQEEQYQLSPEQQMMLMQLLQQQYGEGGEMQAAPAPATPEAAPGGMSEAPPEMMGGAPGGMPDIPPRLSEVARLPHQPQQPETLRPQLKSTETGIEGIGSGSSQVSPGVIPKQASFVEACYTLGAGEAREKIGI